MMTVAVVWIDREHAQLFLLSGNKMERKNFEGRRRDHHLHARDGIDKQREENGLFRELGNELGDAVQILILGPGIAKHHFRNYLTEQLPLIAKRVTGVEAVGHPTDKQINALALRFCKKVSA
jgi:stalled ribosome rescue protein Dom34